MPVPDVGDQGDEADQGYCSIIKQWLRGFPDGL
jgi:hypothetical protein